MQRYFVPITLLIIGIISFSCTMPDGGSRGKDPAEDPIVDPGEDPGVDPDSPFTCIYPLSQQNGIDTNVLLQWNCSLPGNITFELYKAEVLININPPIYSYTRFAAGLKECSYQYQNLEYLTDYTWCVRAIDENGNAVMGPVWFFKTKDRDNMDDLVLRNTSITDGALHQDTRVRLTWACEGLKSSDNVFYELFLGTSPDPPLAFANISEISHIIAGLAENTTYYWSVSVNKQDGPCKRSPVWRFTTRSSQPAGTQAILVVIDGSIYKEIEGSLLQYKADLTADGYFPIFLTWYDRPVGELKEILKYDYENYSLAGAFLIGDIPIARYFVHDVWIATIHNSYYTDLVFPSDIFLMDTDENFTDSDNDGIYDQYTFTPLEIFVARINGNTSQISHYFSKVHSYKTTGSLVDRSAYIFVDNDWWQVHGQRSDNLELLYSDLDFCYEPLESTRDAYINKLTGQGAEFVIQEIHADFPYIIFEYAGATINTDQVEQYNFKASFYIMHNCSAARFTEDNMAMAYLMRTDYGLATFGATENTSGHSVASLIEKLAQGSNWGKAFVYWFNTVSAATTFTEHSTKILEKIIFGDPTLRVTPAF